MSSAPSLASAAAAAAAPLRAHHLPPSRFLCIYRYTGLIPWNIAGVFTPRLPTLIKTQPLPPQHMESNNQIATVISTRVIAFQWRLLLGWEDTRPCALGHKGDAPAALLPAADTGKKLAKHEHYFMLPCVSFSRDTCDIIYALASRYNNYQATMLLLVSGASITYFNISAQRQQLIPALCLIQGDFPISSYFN